MSDKPAPANRTSAAARVGAGKKPRKTRAQMDDVLCRRTMADEDKGFITLWVRLRFGEAMRVIPTAYDK